MFETNISKRESAEEGFDDIVVLVLCNGTMMMVDLQLTDSKGVGCPTVEQESVEQPLVSKNVGGGHFQQR